MTKTSSELVIDLRVLQARRDLAREEHDRRAEALFERALRSLFLTLPNLHTLALCYAKGEGDRLETRCYLDTELIHALIHWEHAKCKDDHGLVPNEGLIVRHQEWVEESLLPFASSLERRWGRGAYRVFRRGASGPALLTADQCWRHPWRR